MSYYCSKCGNYIADGVLHNCGNENLGYYCEQYYNYKCPDCKGEFNTPVIKPGYTSNLEYKCPFCGRIMQGLN